MPNDEIVQNPPSLIQDPSDSIRPILISKKPGSGQFDATKVLAAVGLILTITIILIGILWLTVQNLENRVNSLEGDIASRSGVQKTVASAAAKLATKAAEKSATASAK